jgi:glycyl-tRNA synthetase beta chain
MKPLLFEIGCEEIPARFISNGLRTLRESLVKLLDKASIEYGNIYEYTTPRRLTIFIEDVSEKQKDRTVESLGPPKKVAFDDKGAPTKAAIGFAKSLNIDVKELTIKKTDRGEYVAAVIEEKGSTTKDVLSESLPELISSLQLPKSMRWGSGNLRFFRPIRWILALYGKDVVSFEIDGIKSGNFTYGHRFLSPPTIEIGDPSAYFSLLEKNYVIAKPENRKDIILKGIRDIESSAKCRVHEDDELLETVTHLVEYPIVISGRFDDKYLTLPKELLITVMKTHQKYFSVEDKEGNILPTFIVVSNTKTENNNTVRSGAERVLRARLEDARFYYVEDQKIPLWDYVEELKKVTFQEKLGSLYKKAERITSLCSFLADRLNLLSKENLIRASMMCKADLVTGIVGEFPELQGYMGMVYALNSGEDREAATAIYEHYLPKFPGDLLPSCEIGTIISLADKIDNIASFFFLGLIPTGSEDPFALRRQATGITNILQNNDYPVTLNIMIDQALQGLECPMEKRKSLSDEVLQFFRQRLEGIFLSTGYGHDLINAILSTNELNIKNLAHRIEVLSSLRKEPEFTELLTAAKRVYNILAKAQQKEIKENLLCESAETELYTLAGKIQNKLRNKNFKALFELEKPINAFFDSVLVMDKNPEIRENRIALLFLVKSAFDALGDFSRIVG